MPGDVDVIQKLNMTKIIILLSFICVASISSVIITPALPILKHVFDLSDGQLQWVVSIFLIGYIIGQLLYGPLANRLGTIKSLRLGFSINIIGIILCLIGVWQINYMLLLLGRLVCALGSAAGLACTFILIKELLDEQQAKHTLSYTIVSFSLGIGSAVTIGGFLTQYAHWQYCFWVLLLHGLLMLLCTWLFPNQSKDMPAGIRSILHGYINALRSANLIVYSLLLGSSSVVAYGYSAAAPLITASFLHLNPAQYGVWNLINMIGMLSSGILGAILVKRYAIQNIIRCAVSGYILSILSLF